MSTVRRYLSAEKTARIIEWVDNVNSQPCIGMTVPEPSRTSRQSDSTSSSSIIPATRKRGRPPKYKQLTLKSTKLRRVTVVPREAQQPHGKEEEKVEEGGKHVNKENGVAKKGPDSGRHGEDMGDKAKKEGEQASPSHPISSGKNSNLRMVCVEILVPSSGKHNREKQACGEARTENDKRKRGGIPKGRRGRPKYPKPAADKG